MRGGDVRQRDFVKADQPVALGDALRQRIQGIRRALQRLQLTMNIAHEMMEVHPPLALQRQASVEAVHEKGLAAADGTPEVNAAREIRVHDQSLAARAIIRRPYVDTSRVGVWGWSGGGSSTLHLMFRAPDL